MITLYDPDAPTYSGWWHWVVANIPQGTGSGKASLPAGAIQTRTDFGSTGYSGATPPQGESHLYQFTIHALDVDEGSSGALVGFNLHFHHLGSTTLTVKYT